MEIAKHEDLSCLYVNAICLQAYNVARVYDLAGGKKLPSLVSWQVSVTVILIRREIQSQGKVVFILQSIIHVMGQLTLTALGSTLDVRI